MCSHADPAIADTEFGVGECHEAAAARIAQQHHCLGTASLHLGMGRVHVDDAVLVQAVGVVVLIASAEPEYGIARSGQQWTRVVHTEIAARMAQNDRRLPGSSARRCPQQATHQGSIGRYQANGFAWNVDAGVVVGQGPIVQSERSLPTEMHIEILHDRALYDRVISVLSPNRLHAPGLYSTG